MACAHTAPGPAPRRCAGRRRAGRHPRRPDQRRSPGRQEHPGPHRCRRSSRRAPRSRPGAGPGRRDRRPGRLRRLRRTAGHRRDPARAGTAAGHQGRRRRGPPARPVPAHRLLPAVRHGRRPRRAARPDGNRRALALLPRRTRRRAGRLHRRHLHARPRPATRIGRHPRRLRRQDRARRPPRGHVPRRPAPPPTVPRRVRPSAHRPRRPAAVRHPAQGRAAQTGTPARRQVRDHHRRQLPRIRARTEPADDQRATCRPWRRSSWSNGSPAGPATSAPAPPPHRN